MNSIDTKSLNGLEKSTLKNNVSPSMQEFNTPQALETAKSLLLSPRRIAQLLAVVSCNQIDSTRWYSLSDVMEKLPYQDLYVTKDQVTVKPSPSDRLKTGLALLAERGLVEIKDTGTDKVIWHYAVAQLGDDVVVRITDAGVQLATRFKSEALNG